jgi:MFS-type transporter involved in bile tolerance (Atg22 family)
MWIENPDLFTFSLSASLIGVLSLILMRLSIDCRHCRTIFFGFFLLVGVATLINLQQETNEWILTAGALATMTIGSVVETNRPQRSHASGESA